VQIELSPPLDERVKVVLTPPGQPPADGALDDFTGPSTYEGGAAISFPAAVGVWDVHLRSESGLRAVLGAQVAPEPGELLVTWGMARLSNVDPCAGAAGVVDCDHDELQALPALDDVDDTGDLAVWTECADACGEAWGTSATAQSCTVGGETYDCDDDGDGQPDVTEPYACIGVAGGRDSDGDGECDLADDFPQCRENDPGADA
jgi:hypothetical protein